MKRYAYILLSLIGLASCEPQLPDSPQMLVVEGWIENDAAPMVFVTSSLATTFDEMDVTDLVSHVAFDADVSITYNGVTYPLVPSIRNEYLLKVCYTSSTLKGVVGGTYQLDVNWNGMHVQAVSTIQTPGTVDSMVIERHYNVDSLYMLKVHPVPVPSVRYYEFFCMVVGKESTFYPSNMGIYDSQLNTLDLFNLKRGNNDPISENVYYYTTGDSIRFKIASLEPQAYDFWSKFDENRMFSHSSLLPYTTNLKGNVSGGLGYFFGYGITEYQIRIEK